MPLVPRFVPFARRSRSNPIRRRRLKFSARWPLRWRDWSLPGSSRPAPSAAGSPPPGGAADRLGHSGGVGAAQARDEVTPLDARPLRGYLARRPPPRPTAIPASVSAAIRPANRRADRSSTPAASRPGRGRRRPGLHEPVPHAGEPRQDHVIQVPLERLVQCRLIPSGPRHVIAAVPPRSFPRSRSDGDDDHVREPVPPASCPTRIRQVREVSLEGDWPSVTSRCPLRGRERSPAI